MTAGLRTPQSLFELRPTRLYRRQVGRIRRQVHNLSPTSENCLGNTGNFVRTQLVHHHHVTRLQSRPQDLLGVSPKYLARVAPAIVIKALRPRSERVPIIVTLTPGAAGTLPAIARWVAWPR